MSRDRSACSTPERGASPRPWMPNGPVRSPLVAYPHMSDDQGQSNTPSRRSSRRSTSASRRPSLHSVAESPVATDSREVRPLEKNSAIGLSSESPRKPMLTTTSLHTVSADHESVAGSRSRSSSPKRQTIISPEALAAAEAAVRNVYEAERRTLLADLHSLQTNLEHAMQNRDKLKQHVEEMRREFDNERQFLQRQILEARSHAESFEQYRAAATAPASAPRTYSSLSSALSKPENTSFPQRGVGMSNKSNLNSSFSKPLNLSSSAILEATHYSELPSSGYMHAASDAREINASFHTTTASMAPDATFNTSQVARLRAVNAQLEHRVSTQERLLSAVLSQKANALKPTHKKSPGSKTFRHNTSNTSTISHVSAPLIAPHHHYHPAPIASFHETTSASVPSSVNAHISPPSVPFYRGAETTKSTIIAESMVPRAQYEELAAQHERSLQLLAQVTQEARKQQQLLASMAGMQNQTVVPAAKEEIAAHSSAPTTTKPPPANDKTTDVAALRQELRDLAMDAAAIHRQHNDHAEIIATLVGKLSESVVANRQQQQQQLNQQAEDAAAAPSTQKQALDAMD